MASSLCIVRYTYGMRIRSQSVFDAVFDISMGRVGVKTLAWDEGDVIVER